MDTRVKELRTKVLSFDIDNYDPSTDDYERLNEEVENIEEQIYLLEDEFMFEEEETTAIEFIKIKLKRVKRDFDFYDEEAEYNAMFPDGNDEDDDTF